MGTAVARAVHNDLAQRATVLYVPGTLTIGVDDFTRLMDSKDGSRTGIVAQNVEITPRQRPIECTEHRGHALDSEGKSAVCGGVRTKVTMSDIGTTVWNWWNGS